MELTESSFHHIADPNVRKQLLFPNAIYKELNIDINSNFIKSYNDKSQPSIINDIQKFITNEVSFSDEFGMIYYLIPGETIRIINFPRLVLIPFIGELQVKYCYEFIQNKEENDYDTFISKVESFLESIRNLPRRNIFTADGKPGIDYLGDVSKIISKRSLDTVWIAKPIKDQIVSLIKSFFTKEEESFRHCHGISHKMTLAFTGPPGTGKTSFVRALASEFNLGIRHINLCAPEQNIAVKLSTVPYNSIILIEDIDTMFESLGGDHNPHASMSVAGFINALDGISSVEGCVTILTCNNAKILKLDQIRRGRIDHIFSFEKMTLDSIIGMIKSFFSNIPEDRIKALASKVNSYNISPNDLQHYILSNRNDFSSFEKSMGGFQSSVNYFHKAQEHNASLMRSYQNPNGVYGYT